MTILGDLQPTAIIDSGSRRMIIWRNDNQRGVLILSYMHDPVQSRAYYVYTVMWKSAKAAMIDFSSGHASFVSEAAILGKLNWMMRK